MSYPYIADYGLACTRENTCMGTAAVMGTAAYSAPEVFDCVYSAQTDIWALGCVLYELLSQNLIWKEVGRKPMVIQRHFFFKRGPSILQLQSTAAKDCPSATVIAEKLSTL